MKSQIGRQVFWPGSLPAFMSPCQLGLSFFTGSSFAAYVCTLAHHCCPVGTAVPYLVHLPLGSRLVPTCRMRL